VIILPDPEGIRISGKRCKWKKKCKYYNVFPAKAYHDYGQFMSIENTLLFLISNQS
jgi:hypothetical protein